MIIYKSAVGFFPGRGERRLSDNYYFNSKIITEELDNSRIKLAQKSAKPGLQVYGISSGTYAPVFGRRVSYAAVSCLKKYHAVLVKKPDSNIADIFREFFKEASLAVSVRNSGSGTESRAAIAVVGLTENVATVANVGDVRVYRYDGESLKLLSEEHTQARKMVDMGLLTEKKAAFHPQRRKLTRYLGGSQETAVPSIKSFECGGGETFIVCGSGCNDFISEEKLTEIIKNSETPSDAVDAFAAVFGSESSEDCSVIIIKTYDDGLNVYSENSKKNGAESVFQTAAAGAAVSEYKVRAEEHAEANTDETPLPVDASEKMVDSCDAVRGADTYRSESGAEADSVAFSGVKAVNESTVLGADSDFFASPSIEAGNYGDSAGFDGNAYADSKGDASFDKDGSFDDFVRRGVSDESVSEIESEGDFGLGFFGVSGDESDKYDWSAEYGSENKDKDEFFESELGSGDEAEINDEAVEDEDYVGGEIAAASLSKKSNNGFVAAMKRFVGMDADDEGDNDQIWPALIVFIICIVFIILLFIFGWEMVKSNKGDAAGNTASPEPGYTASVSTPGAETAGPSATETPEAPTPEITAAVNTEAPTNAPAVTEAPTNVPTASPAGTPAAEPTAEPGAEPTAEPSAEPTEEPTAEPTEEPTAEPTEEPTAEPTEEPTAGPTEEPTPEPTDNVTDTAEPTEGTEGENTPEPPEPEGDNAGEP